MTLVTLPIGRLVPASRPHSSWPVPASARSAPSAPTPAGAAVTGPPTRVALAGVLARKVLAGRALAGTVPVDAALAGAALAAATATARTAPKIGGTARRAGGRMARKVITS